MCFFCGETREIHSKNLWSPTLNVRSISLHLGSLGGKSFFYRCTFCFLANRGNNHCTISSCNYFRKVPQTTIYLMDVWWNYTICHVKIWNLESSNWNKWMFKVPGGRVCLPTSSFFTATVFSTHERLEPSHIFPIQWLLGKLWQIMLENPNMTRHVWVYPLVHQHSGKTPIFPGKISSEMGGFSS